MVPTCAVRPGRYGHLNHGVDEPKGLAKGVR